MKIPEKEYFAIENETLQIPCDGAKKSFKVSWFFNNLTISLPNDQFEVMHLIYDVRTNYILTQKRTANRYKFADKKN